VFGAAPVGDVKGLVPDDVGAKELVLEELSELEETTTDDVLPAEAEVADVSEEVPEAVVVTEDTELVIGSL